jgi:hypothetical protein
VANERVFTGVELARGVFREYWATVLGGRFDTDVIAATSRSDAFHGF